MKKALISLLEERVDGYRVAQVVEIGSEFEVAEGLEWRDCADDIVADVHYFSPFDDSFKLLVVEPPGPASGSA